MGAFRLSSPAFDHDSDIPERYRADGGDRSPPLEWEGVPDGTKELVLICDDPDADEGVLTHWVVYGIPPDVTALPEGLDRDAVLTEPVDLVQGFNEFGELGYVGPHSAEDRGPHRFFFRLFALDAELLEVPPGATRADLRDMAKDHVIGQAELVGIG